MRHLKKGRKLNRSVSHRKALFRNMATSLFRHERIETTDAKAKELRGYAEKLITLAKTDDVHSRRLAFQKIRDKEVLSKLRRHRPPLQGPPRGLHPRDQDSRSPWRQRDDVSHRVGG